MNEKIQQAFERGFVKAAVEAGFSEKQARDTMNLAHQQLMPQYDKRQLSLDELVAIEQAKGKLLPKIFTSYKDPVTAKMYSTALPTGLGALLGGGAGALLGSALTGGSGTGLGVGALLGGGLGGAFGHFNQKARNESLEEQMTRLPVGATLRDYYADPLYQKNQDIARENHNNMMIRMLLSKR